MPKVTLPPIIPAPGPELDTGPGGFGIDGQQMLFDVGLPEPSNPTSPYGAYVPGVDASAATTDASGKPKDLTQVTKTTLAQYLSNLTKGKEGPGPAIANAYPVDSLTTTQISLTDEKGYPAALEALPNNEKTFAGLNEGTIGYPSPDYTSISPYLKKGIAPGTGIGGNDLLPGVAGNSTTVASPNNQTGDNSGTPQPIIGHPSTDSKLNTYQVSVLSSNRFTGAAQSYVSTQSVSDPPPTYDPNFAVQGKLGMHDPAASTLSAGRLAAIGPLMTLRAARSLGANSPGADPNSGGIQAGALLPSPTQLGIATIDQATMLASDILATLTADEVPSANVLSVGSQSWGVMNDTEDPFSGIDALGMLTLSVALVAGIELLFDGLGFLLGLITPSTKKPSRDNQGRYTLGEYFSGTKAGTKAASGGIGGSISALSTLNFGALLGIQPTSFPFKQALSQGTNAFFGIPSGGGVLGQLAGAVTSSADSPGFNAVVARAIIRSSITITQALGKIGGNPMNVINSILSMIDTVRSSKIIAACNVFAMLGDAILSNPAVWQDADQPNKTSAMDAYPNDMANSTVAKNRLQGVLKLAWASNRAPANVLLPASVMGLNRVLSAPGGFGQFDAIMGLGQDGYSNVHLSLTKAADGGRIDSDTAATFEKTLAASYVPFYFHDVRTNEMISFHAFLASLTDDYVAGYDKTEGFGRVEPVKIYKGTERRINLSFYVVATSLPDFDDMWVKINKLVTLVYPQYTQGVQLSSADKSYQFTQPFSQLMGASPMIRIRLGDLLRSNYSLFALGRLFGMADQGFQVGQNGPFVGADSLSQGDLDALQSALLKAQANPTSEIYIPTAGTYELYDSTGGGPGGLSVPSPPLPGSTGGSPQYAPQFKASDGGVFEIKASKLDPNNPTVIVGTVQFRTDPQFQDYYKQYQTNLTNWYDNPDKLDTRYIGGTYLFPVNMLGWTTLAENVVVNKLQAWNSLTSQNNGFVTDITDFLDPTKNSVAKSFKDTAGKGLAGFIETMNFDWFDKVTWETQDGRVAPKMCKVTIGFSPIHDISPGIDSQGFNRGPLYPVGVMGQH